MNRVCKVTILLALSICVGLQAYGCSSPAPEKTETPGNVTQDMNIPKTDGTVPDSKSDAEPE